ncbi:zinc finger protein [Aphelenchoides avenae]|nr:zinc finger protein [Aphelenchus avenae]
MPGPRKLRRGRPLENWKAAFNDIMKRKSARIPAATTRQAVQQRANNSDCEVLSPYTVSLRCPRIQVASRGVNCTHLQCFDLATFLEGPASSGLWHCPICSKDTKLDGLRIDELLNEILQSFAADANVQAVELLSNGTFQGHRAEVATPDVCINDESPYKPEPKGVKSELMEESTIHPDPTGNETISPSAPYVQSGVAADVAQTISSSQLAVQAVSFEGVSLGQQVAKHNDFQVSVKPIWPSPAYSTFATSDVFTYDASLCALAAKTIEPAPIESHRIQPEPAGNDAVSPGDPSGLKAYETQPATVPMPTEEEVGTLSRANAEPCSPCAVEFMDLAQHHGATEATLVDKEVQTACVANEAATHVQALRAELQRIYQELSAEKAARQDLTVQLANTIEDRLNEKVRLHDIEQLNRTFEARIQVLVQQLDALKKAKAVEQLAIASVATCAQQSQASAIFAQHQQQEYVQQLHARIHAQQVQGEAYMKQLLESVTEKIGLEGRLKTVEEAAAYFEKRLNDQHLENDNLRAYASEVNVLEGRLKTVEGTAENLEKQLKDQRLENDNLRAKNGAEAHKYASELSVLEGRLKTIEGTAEYLTKQLNGQRLENESLKKANSAQAQKYASEVMRLRQALREADDACRSMDHHQNYVHQLHARIHAQELEGEAYVKQLLESGREKTVLEGRLKTVEATAATVKKRLNDQRLENEDLKAKNSAQAQKSEVNVLEGKLKTVERDAEYFKTRLNEQRLENDDLKARNSAQAQKYASEITRLKNNVAALRDADAASQSKSESESESGTFKLF